MVKKIALIALTLAVTFAGVVTVASAAQNVANTTQKGSLLIWPKILVQHHQNEFDGFLDTQIYVGNDYFQDVWVKCYWVDADQNIEDFMFRLTPNQPVVFSAASGYGSEGVDVPPFVIDGNATGELKCWAVNDAGTEQISFNHLYGNAWIHPLNPGLGQGRYGLGVMYNAYAFAAKQPFGSTVGTAGTLSLNGTTGYDACPQYLVANFMPANAVLGPDLTLVPCKQDLRQDRTPTCTKAKFDVWNANETKFTGAYQCIKCWFEGELDELRPPKGYGGDKFTYYTLKTEVARFRVQGVASTVCKNKFLTPDPLNPGKYLDICPNGAAPSPLLGLLLYVEYLEPGYNVPIGGITPAGAGADGSGFVYWDPQTPPAEAPGK
jgi:hypothetical protein